MKTNLFAILVTLLISTHFGLNAQTIVKNGIDEFTGARVIETSQHYLYGNNTHFYFYSINNLTYIIFTWYNTDTSISIQNNTKIYFLLDNGDVLTLLSVDDSIRDSNNITFKATGDFSLLLDNYVDKIRIGTSKGYVVFNLKNGTSRPIPATYRILSSCKSINHNSITNAKINAKKIWIKEK